MLYGGGGGGGGEGRGTSLTDGRAAGVQSPWCQIEEEFGMPNGVNFGSKYCQMGLMYMCTPVCGA